MKGVIKFFFQKIIGADRKERQRVCVCVCVWGGGGGNKWADIKQKKISERKWIKGKK